jgi:hypothetical protein
MEPNPSFCAYCASLRQFPLERPKKIQAGTSQYKLLTLCAFFAKKVSKSDKGLESRPIARRVSPPNRAVFDPEKHAKTRLK